MNIVLIPIAGLMLILLVFVLKSIPPKENNRERIIKALIILLFVAAFITVCIFVPYKSFQ